MENAPNEAKPCAKCRHPHEGKACDCGCEAFEARKPYKSPTLTYLGTVKDLTHSGNTSMGPDAITSKKTGQ